MDGTHYYLLLAAVFVLGLVIGLLIGCWLGYWHGRGEALTDVEKNLRQRLESREIRERERML